MSQDFSQRLNDMPEGWLQAMGITITKATADEVRAEMTVGPEHLQGYGIVHGGVHCGIIESLASIGAALYALPRSQSVVGLENNTSFIRAVRAGATLRAVATPITRGRKTRPNLKVGICGEHGGDPASVAFCHEIGLDYVSCSPYRVPIARLAAAQAALGKTVASQA